LLFGGALDKVVDDKRRESIRMAGFWATVPHQAVTVTAEKSFKPRRPTNLATSGCLHLREMSFGMFRSMPIGKYKRQHYGVSTDHGRIVPLEDPVDMRC
jgi:hypothetical protein